MEGLFLAEQPLLALHSLGHLSGCVADVGHDKCGEVVLPLRPGRLQTMSWLLCTWRVQVTKVQACLKQSHGRARAHARWRLPVHPAWAHPPCPATCTWADARLGGLQT